eukprot:c25269_g1_i2 orf=139-1101(+)
MGPFVNRVEEAVPELPLPINLMIIGAVCGLVGLVWWRIWVRGERQRCRGGGRLPPGPPSWPVIGHLHLLGKLPHQDLAELARRHAPHLMSLRLGSVPFLVASSPEAAKLILNTHDQVFASRPRSSASVNVAFNNSGIAFCPTSPYWRRMRGLSSMNLFTHSSICSFQPMRRAEVRELLSSVFAQSQKLIQLRPMLREASLNMISRMAIGQQLSDLAKQNSTLSDIADLADQIMHLLGVFDLGDFAPFLAWLDLQGYVRRMKVMGRRWSAALQVVLDLRRATMREKPQQGKDMLDVLLAVPDINDENIKAVLAVIYNPYSI